MRWFKHLSSAQNDEAMSELIDEFGPLGYGVWWIILEMIAVHMDKSDRCFARYSLRKWSKNCGISTKKFQKVVNFLSKLEKLTIKKCGKNSDFLIIECRNLLKFRDEYSKKSGQNPDKLRIKSGVTPEQDTDTDTDTENNNNNIYNFSTVDERVHMMSKQLQEHEDQCKTTLKIEDNL